MRRSTLLSIGAGFSAAAILMVLLWHSAGRAYVLSQGPLSQVDLLRVGLLFWGPFMPDAIAISLVAGLIVGLVPPGRRIRFGPVRAIVCTLAFGTAFLLQQMLVAGRFGRLDAMMVVAVLVGAPLFGCIGAAVFIPPAMLGALAGEKIANRPPRARYGATLLAIAAVIAVISFHGALVRLSVRHARPNLRAAEGLVKLNLADPPKTAEFVPILSDEYYPKVVGYRQDLKDGDLTVTFGRGGKLNSANLYLVSPGRNNVPKTVLLQMEKRYRVSPELAADVRQDIPGWWNAKTGPYSMTVADRYPPSDD